MSKNRKAKIKNRHKHGAKHKEAHQRKQESQAELESLGLDLSCDTLSFGIVFEHLGISQATFFCINEVNKLCQKYVGLNIQLFAQHSMRSCIQPLCPVGDAVSLISWTHPLIATSISTCIDALSSPSQLIYHYVFDLDFIGQSLSTADLLRTFCDPRVRIVTRHQHYKEVLEEEFNIQIQQPIIPDFQLVNFVRSIVSETRNVKTIPVSNV